MGALILHRSSPGRTSFLEHESGQFVSVRARLRSSCGGRMKLLDAIRDARLFAEPFADPSWIPWRVLIAEPFARAPPDARGFQLYREVTGRERWPSASSVEAARRTSDRCARCS